MSTCYDHSLTAFKAIASDAAAARHPLEAGQAAATFNQQLPLQELSSALTGLLLVTHGGFFERIDSFSAANAKFGIRVGLCAHNDVDRRKFLSPEACDAEFATIFPRLFDPNGVYYLDALPATISAVIPADGSAFTELSISVNSQPPAPPITMPALEATAALITYSADNVA